MYSFDGKHKTRTKVSLGGASKQVEKTALLQAAREERMKRELSRKKNISVLMIQSWYRACVARKILARKYRREYDMILKGLEKRELDVQLLKDSCSLLIQFFKLSDDYQRLVSICQILLKLVSSKKINVLFNKDSAIWLSKIKRLLSLCSKSLHAASHLNISIPLRMLEVFTSEKYYQWIADQNERANIIASVHVFLIKRGFFNDLKALLIFRVPSSIEPSSVPPTPLAEAIKDLLLKPLLLAQSPNKRIILSSLVMDVLACPMSAQVCYYLLPAIATAFDLSLLICIINESGSNVQTIWMLYSLFLIYKTQANTLSMESVKEMVHVLRRLVISWHIKKEKPSNTNDSDEDSDEDMEITITETEAEKQDSMCFSYVKQRLLEMINTDILISPVLNALNRSIDEESRFELVEDLCVMAYHLITELNLQVYKTKFLYSLAFSKTFLRLTWHRTTSLSTKTNTGKSAKLLQQISFGHSMTVYDQMRVIPMLGTFTTLFRYVLFSIYDNDFYNTSLGPTSLMPFTIPEVIEMSNILRNTILGLIIFIYPDVRIQETTNNCQWYTLCQMVTQLVKQLYARDCRHRFCPEQHWLSSRAALNNAAVQISTFLDEEEGDALADQQPRMSTLNLRNLAILKFVPFAVPFLQRVLIFQKIIQEDKNIHQGAEQHFNMSQGFNITINRKYLYQDAYDQLAKENCPDIKKLMRVQMKNVQGLDEAGIDGGGVFREFITLLIKTAYDPSYAYFKSSSQQLLYPNPDVGIIQPDYLKHMHFLGRILGKVIYESMMVELPLAGFFLCKLLNRHGSDVDIHYLESLDQELYKNLFELKNYQGDADDLSLNFTVVESGYGDTRVKELKPGGKDICVDNNNKIEYIHLMANYKLNKQIRSHCNAFRAGLSDVINIEWLQMFSHNELQVLISGARVAIDVDDLKKNTNYSGSFNADDFYIMEFWTIIESLTDKQKQDFLKFVTSCSRPPLLGFSELYPKFCIHYGGEEDRLPTASTCMNFLKLPKYNTKELLRKRLVYAIEANAGFELS